MGKKILGIRISAPERKDGKITPGDISWAIINQNEDFEFGLTPDKVLASARQIIGIHIKETRERKGITINSVGAIAKCTVLDIQNIENGGIYDINVFLKVIAAVDCYFYLADREGNHGKLQDLKNKSKY